MRRRDTDTVPAWLRRETFAVEYNPNCPSPYLVRLVGKGVGQITHDNRDARGYGQTLREAAIAALASRVSDGGRFEASVRRCSQSFRDFELALRRLADQGMRF